jgi:hypothetical protein
VSCPGQREEKQRRPGLDRVWGFFYLFLKLFLLYFKTVCALILKPFKQKFEFDYRVIKRDKIRDKEL